MHGAIDDLRVYPRGLTDGEVATVMNAATQPPPAAFTDDPLTAGVHTMKVVHITELRTRINTLRSNYGLAATSWPSGTLTAGTTFIRAAHIVELRDALGALYAALKRTAPTYTDSTITAGSTGIKAVHIAELRAAVKALE
jgi:hypothetical protein